jgi:hypothetical protein
MSSTNPFQRLWLLRIIQYFSREEVHVYLWSKSQKGPLLNSRIMVIAATAAAASWWRSRGLKLVRSIGAV